MQCVIGKGIWNIMHKKKPKKTQNQESVVNSKKKRAQILKNEYCNFEAQSLVQYIHISPIPCLFHKELHCHFLCTWNNNKYGSLIHGKLFPVHFFLIIFSVWYSETNTMKIKSNCMFLSRLNISKHLGHFPSSLQWKCPECVRLVAQSAKSSTFLPEDSSDFCFYFWYWQSKILQNSSLLSFHHSSTPPLALWRKLRSPCCPRNDGLHSDYSLLGFLSNK